MLIEIILFLFLGLVAGTITGLVPGIHINLVGVTLVALSASILSSISPIYITVFIVSMAITHTFIDFIPSIFLGCPDTDTELSILPGHELLKQGKGYEAIMLTAYGSLAAVFGLVLIVFPSKILIDLFYGFLTKGYVMPALLSIVAISLILLEKQKLQAILVFILTGALGFIVLNLNVKEPLLPLLSGLFGASMLITSMKTKVKIPKQKIDKDSVKLKKIKKPLISAFIGSLIASPISSFLPGLGSGQAAVIGNLISKSDRRGFLILLGSTNTLVMGFSFVAFYFISRTRTGAATAIAEIVGNFSIEILILILITILISGTIAFFLTKFLAEKMSKIFTKINYTKLSLIVLIFLSFLILIVSKPIGLLILITSTITGIYCISFNVKRTNMMGCLLIPTIIFYLGI